MKKEWMCLLVAGLAGCDSLGIVLDLGGLTRRSITLRLVNETESTVEPSVFVSDLDNVILEGLTESLLTLDSNRQDFGDLPAGEVRTRTYDCDDFKAVMAQDARLVTGVGLTPDDSTGILVDDEDFRCGDTVVITYSGGLLDFDARIAVVPAGL